MAGLKIEGAIDMHCHFGPDTIGTRTDYPHAITGLEAAREAFETGHKAIVLNSHSFATPPADLGAAIEMTAQCCDHVWGHQGKTIAQMIAMIREIGHERCTLSTDYGWNPEAPRPAPGLKNFLERLWAEGLSEQQLSRMVAENPARLLAL